MQFGEWLAVAHAAEKTLAKALDNGSMQGSFDENGCARDSSCIVAFGQRGGICMAN